MLLGDEAMMFDGLDVVSQHRHEWEGVHLDLAFTLPWHMVISVQRLPHHPAVPRYASSLWTCLKTTCETAWMRHILLCMGELDPHAQSTAKQEALLKTLTWKMKHQGTLVAQ